MRAMLRRIKSAYTVLRYPLWVPPGHYYSPLADKADVSRAISQIDTNEEPIAIELNGTDQRGLAELLAQHWSEVPTVPDPQWRYNPHNLWFGLADAAVYYSILCHFRPSRVVEVGSGFSSAIALDAAERCLPDLKLTFIEPDPRRLLGVLKKSDEPRCQLLKSPVQDVPLGVYDELSSGDIVFIDSTHVSKPGSDVNWLLFEVLPRLRPGVHVHFHDLFWPFEYPKEWILERRGWTEAYMVRAFLSYNKTFKIELFTSWLWGVAPELVKKALPAAVDAQPGSLWIRKC
ncbi:MAG: class I SAM-dependent methyltransferase [Pseudonocardiales bacterium]|jgi:Methyltransferase domain|nr:class I SAM-dependent methyltransferase [Pseudonocardiales bacterium]MBV9650347.1 class I SAM-dependent methyltransferase [Pseudonocardiales bacterium]